MPAPRMPRVPGDREEPAPFMMPPAGSDINPARVPDGSPTRPPRHVLRPASEYVEYEEENRLHIPRHLIPDGFALQWVTHSVWGKEETQHRASFERQGWVSILADDEIGTTLAGMFMPAGAKGEIMVEGLVLMARPLAWSEKARELERKRARERVQIKEHQLRSGDLNGVTLSADHPTAVRSNVIARSMDTVSMPVPDR